MGPEVVPGELAASFSSAVVALRLRRDAESVAYADELGAVVALVQAMDATGREPGDVERVRRLQQDASMTRILDALVDAPSLRSAAAALGLHHSSLQGRVDQLAGALGFDVTTPHGRTRLDLALALSRARRGLGGTAAQ